MPPARPRHDPRGFTLIELLVVIALVGVVAGIAVPIISNVLSGAQTAADDASVQLEQSFRDQYANFIVVDSDGANDGQGTVFAYNVNADGSQGALLGQIADAGQIADTGADSPAAQQTASYLSWVTAAHADGLWVGTKTVDGQPVFGAWAAWGEGVTADAPVSTAPSTPDVALDYQFFTEHGTWHLYAQDADGAWQFVTAGGRYEFGSYDAASTFRADLEAFALAAEGAGYYSYSYDEATSTLTALDWAGNVYEATFDASALGPDGYISNGDGIAVGWPLAYTSDPAGEGRVWLPVFSG